MCACDVEVVVFCQNVLFCMLHAEKFVIFVAFFVAQPFWHDFGYIINVPAWHSARTLIKQNRYNYEH